MLEVWGIWLPDQSALEDFEEELLEPLLLLEEGSAVESWAVVPWLVPVEAPVLALTEESLAAGSPEESWGVEVADAAGWLQESNRPESVKVSMARNVDLFMRVFSHFSFGFTNAENALYPLGEHSRTIGVTPA